MQWQTAKTQATIELDWRGMCVYTDFEQRSFDESMHSSTDGLMINEKFTRVSMLLNSQSRTLFPRGIGSSELTNVRKFTSIVYKFSIRSASISNLNQLATRFEKDGGPMGQAPKWVQEHCSETPKGIEGKCTSPRLATTSKIDR